MDHQVTTFKDLFDGPLPDLTDDEPLAGSRGGPLHYTGGVISIETVR